MWRDRWWRSLNVSLHMGHFSLSLLSLVSLSSLSARLWWDLMCCTRSDVKWKEMLHLAHQFWKGRPREDREGVSSDCRRLVCGCSRWEVLGQRFASLERPVFSKAELWKLSGRMLGRIDVRLVMRLLVRLDDISGIWGGGCVNALFLFLSPWTSFDTLVVNADFVTIVLDFKSWLSRTFVQLSWHSDWLHGEFWPLLKDFSLEDNQEHLFTPLTQNLFTNTFSSPWVSKDSGSPSLSSVSDSRERLLLGLFASVGRFFLQFSSSRAKLWKFVAGLRLWISGMVIFFKKLEGFFMQKNLLCATRGNSKRKLCLHSEQIKPKREIK